MSRRGRSNSSENGVRHRTHATRHSGTFQPPALPKWVPDAEQSSCMICSRKFGLVSRRHHCRNCGILVCQSCSSHTIPLLQSGDTPVRVCDRCYETLTVPDDTETRTIMPAVKGEPVIRRSQSWADPRYERPKLPSWTYAVAAVAAPECPAAIGTLLIRVRSSTALPPVDYFGTADPYVVVKLSEQLVRTKVQPKTLTPTWNEEFILDVFNSTSTLRLEVWDSDQLGNDRLMGHASIPLLDLSHQLRVARSLPITWAEREGTSKTPTTTAHLSVELHYRYDTFGDFVSQFNPDNESPPVEPEFDLDILYNECVKLWNLLQPMLTVWTGFSSLTNWSTHPFIAFFVFLIYLGLAMYPYMIPILLHIIVIRYIIFQYFYRVGERGSEKEKIREQSMMQQGEHGTNGINGVNGTNETTITSIPPLAPVFVGTVNEATHIAGMTDELTSLQHQISHICSFLESISNLLTWKSTSATRNFLIVLFLSLLYCIFLPQNYWLLVCGLTLLTHQTAPMRTLKWLWDGCVRYITTKRVDPKSVPRDEIVPIPRGPRPLGMERVHERLMAELE